MRMYVVTALLLSLLSSCNSTYHEPQLGVDHPANPDAPVPPLPERSHALSHPVDEHAHAEAAPPATVPASLPDESAAYVCPMHPAVTSDKPDQRCPECGMKLVPKSEVDGHR
jgi:hypothetical protein